MFEEYKAHNLFQISLETFKERDPQISVLKELSFVHPMDWWRGIDWTKPGIYVVTGGRQIGKTTSTKLMILKLLTEEKFNKNNIFYLPCDQIDDHRSLGQIVRTILQKTDTKKRALIVIDEITYVKEWDRAIKAIADEGLFRQSFCIITGSDSIILNEAMSRFPGRRGEAQKTDFHISPLDFFEYVQLVEPALIDKKSTNRNNELMRLFDNYLKCGGHLRAINDLHKNGTVSPSTHAVFEQWIRGDIQKRGKTVSHLEDILKAFIETGGSQITFSSLAARIGEISKPTLIDYSELLERLDVIFNLQAFDQNRRIGFPKKARKFHFWDPFIFETARLWLERELKIPAGIDLDPVKAESIVAAHFKKRSPTFYFKGNGEIDVVTHYKKNVFYLEVKWTKQIRSWDLAELGKRKRAFVLTRLLEAGEIEGIPVIPIPQFLVDFDGFMN